MSEKYCSDRWEIQAMINGLPFDLHHPLIDSRAIVL